MVLTVWQVLPVTLGLPEEQLLQISLLEQLTQLVMLQRIQYVEMFALDTVANV